METWQEEHITKNLPRLLKITRCTTELLAFLEAEKILGDGDIDDIKTTRRELDKTKLLYDIVKTRSNGYISLAKSFIESRNTGALEILMEGFPSHKFLDTKFNLLGNVKTLKEMFDEKDVNQLWPALKQTLDAKSYLELCTTPTIADTTIPLVNDTIPLPLPDYISRSLAQRVLINPHLFTIPCSDVFVIKGMGRVELTALASPRKTDRSSSQTKEITSQFIFLEDNDDWEEIRSIAKMPVHLIQYEEQGDRYIWKETAGGAGSIRQFAQILESDSDTCPAFITDDHFIEKMEQGGSTAVCISELPGMGKTILLSNLANLTAQKYPERIVAFISLSGFTDGLPESLSPDTVKAEFVRNLLVKYLSPSALTQVVLNKLLEKGEIPMELFFDGFDEVLPQNVEIAKAILSLIANNFPRTRIYVTSRPHTSHQIEATLRVIAYDITPFHEENQIDLLTNTWKRCTTAEGCDPSRLKTFAQFCLKSLKRKMADGDTEVTGIPLQCRLLAEVYENYAIKYAKSGRDIFLEASYVFEISLADLYKKFVDLRFAKLQLSLDLSTVTILGSQQGQDTNQLLTPQDTMYQEIQNIKMFYMWNALKVIYPDIAKEYGNISNANKTTAADNLKHMSIGILHQRNTGNSDSMDFMHRSFAEYFVSEFFAEILIQPNCNTRPVKKFQIKLVNFLFETVLDARFDGHPFNSLLPVYAFQFPVIAYFFNASLKRKLPSDIPTMHLQKPSFTLFLKKDRLYSVCI